MKKIKIRICKIKDSTFGTYIIRILYYYELYTQKAIFNNFFFKPYGL